MPHPPHRMGPDAKRLGAAGTTPVRSLDANAKAAHQRITAEMGAASKGGAGVTCDSSSQSLSRDFDCTNIRICQMCAA